MRQRQPSPSERRSSSIAPARRRDPFHQEQGRTPMDRILGHYTRPTTSDQTNRHDLHQACRFRRGGRAPASCARWRRIASAECREAKLAWGCSPGDLSGSVCTVSSPSSHCGGCLLRRQASASHHEPRSRMAAGHRRRRRAASSTGVAHGAMLDLVGRSRPGGS